MEQIIIGEKPIMMAEVKEELERIKKRDAELNFRAAKTEEYLQHFVVLNAKKARELYDKIIKMDIPRLRDIHISKIIDLLPSTVNELKTILHGYTITVSNENMKKIVDSIGEFRK